MKSNWALWGVGFVFLFVGCASGSKSADRKQRASLHLQMATALMENGKLPEALSELSLAESLAPDDASIQNDMGLVYQLREKYQLAEPRFLKALELAPKYTDARANLARLYIDKGDYQKALKQISLVEQDLTYGAPEKALMLKGMTYYKMGNLKSAETYLVKAYEMQRKSCLTAYFLGRSYYDEKRLKDASQMLDQAIDNCKTAKFEEPLFYSAMAHYGLGEKLEAKARAEELMTDYPKSKLASKAKALLQIVDDL